MKENYTMHTNSYSQKFRESGVKIYLFLSILSSICLLFQYLQGNFFSTNVHYSSLFQQTTDQLSPDCTGHASMLAHTHTNIQFSTKGEMQIQFQLKQSKRSGIFSCCFIFLTTTFNSSYKLKSCVRCCCFNKWLQLLSFSQELQLFFLRTGLTLINLLSKATLH